ncbi:hypothetical protein GPJ56_001001 [Histomonas meleagridis]|uniref:uncharacterized protein n=1 Tax=Histomonas meleagridis TaxID=135588 RepID=UPI0035595CE4|nr:hypothetical protein GPJ56_001001 [Histomonas meleagridis]KAH0803838.1 hypothetical protein GO595_002668 [Histomonas meleagridis]
MLFVFFLALIGSVENNSKDPIPNKINWKGIWNGLKKVVNFLQKLFVLIDESFDEENGQPVFNGFKVIDVQVDDNDEVRNIVLQNDDGVKVLVHTEIADFGDVEEPASNKWNWGKIWNVVKKVICFVADLIRGNSLELSTVDGEETVTFGDYSITEVKLDDNDQPQGIQLENAAGNKIIFHVEIGSPNNAAIPNKFSWKKLWNGIKKVVNFLQKLFVLIDESFEETEEGLSFNGYKVIDIQLTEDNKPKEIVLENEQGTQIILDTTLTDFDTVVLDDDNKWNWSKIWNVVKKVICFVADLIRGNLELTTKDGEEQPVLGDYLITDVDLDEEETPQGITLENEAGNKIKIKISIGSNSAPVANKFSWKKLWNGIKKVVNFLQKLFVLIDESFEEDGEEFKFNGFTVTNLEFTETEQPKEIVLENEEGVKIILDTTLVDFESESFMEGENKWNWSKIWNVVKKVICFVADLIRGNLELTTKDGEEQPVLGDYSITDVDLDENETPQGITLENEAGNKIKIKISIGSNSAPVANKFSWKKLWNGIKKVVNFLQKLFVLIDESFDEENGQPVFNGFKVIDIQVDDNDEVRNIVLQNEDGVKVTVHTEIADFGDVEEPSTNKWNWGKIWNVVKKVICFVADLIRGNSLELSTLDGEETVTFGDYSITDVQLDDNEQPQGIQLENAAGNKITFHIEF